MISNLIFFLITLFLGVKHYVRRNKINEAFKYFLFVDTISKDLPTWTYVQIKYAKFWTYCSGIYFLGFIIGLLNLYIPNTLLTYINNFFSI
ncbi:MAG: hypothetical protein ACRC41_10390, partial [Sarcina sp.]